ncbi:hypothetical protein TgHK011_006614 [Trichoderma gracile]|nr:hypothetical protein TgHK011_006614 [Trichoderma gracile]
MYLSITTHHPLTTLGRLFTFTGAASTERETRFVLVYWTTTGALSSTRYIASSPVRAHFPQCAGHSRAGTGTQEQARHKALQNAVWR